MKKNYTSTQQKLYSDYIEYSTEKLNEMVNSNKYNHDAIEIFKDIIDDRNVGDNSADSIVNEITETTLPKNNRSFLVVMITLSILAEIFSLYSVFDISNKLSSNEGSITMQNDGTYLATLNDYTQSYNYWIYEWKYLTITIPLILIIYLFILYKKHNKKENPVIINKRQ